MTDILKTLSLFLFVALPFFANEDPAVTSARDAEPLDNNQRAALRMDHLPTL